MPSKTFYFRRQLRFHFLWVIGLAALASAVMAADSPPSSDVVISSPTLWSLVGFQGDVREIWAGPKDRNGAPAGEPEGVLKTSGYGQILSDGRWTDLPALTFSHAESRPGRLVLASQDSRVHIIFSTRRSSPGSPIFIRYQFTQPTDFRFRLELKDSQPIVRVAVPSNIGASSLQVHDSMQVNLATSPVGEDVSGESKNSPIREVRQATAVIVCLYLGSSLPAANSAESAAQAWIRRTGGTEDSKADRMRNRLRVHTGLQDFDRLLAYSVDAVESARFQSGVLIAGRDGWYKNTWIRDGTYSTIGTDLFGLRAQGDAFYDYWIRNGSYSWGGEREAQQPAIAILGIWFHSRLIEDDKPFLTLAFPYVSHFADYYRQRIEKEGMINTAEEWICQVPTKTAWPNAEIYTGMRAAAKIARRLGHASDGEKWDAAAQTLQETILKTAYDPNLHRFIPLAGPAGVIYKDQEDPTNTETSGPERDERVDSGMLMLARLEVFARGLGAVAVDDPRFAGTQAWIHKVLEQPDHSISRFEGNPESSHYPKGEWPVWPLNSSIAADIELLRGRNDRAWRYLLSGLVRKRGYDAEAAVYSLPEQWDFDGQAVSTRQLTWSHGEFLTSSVLLLTGLQVDVPDADLALAPSLPPGSDTTTIENFHFRDWKLDLTMKRDGDNVRVDLIANCGSEKQAASGQRSVLRIALPGQVIEAHSGEPIHFNVHGSPDRAGDGRTAHAWERAQLFSQILAGKKLSGVPENADSAELEMRIRQIEDEFDQRKER